MTPHGARETPLAVLDRLDGVRAAVVGDLALDAYWFLDGSCDERSVETGRTIARVERQAYSLGGAANVAANLRALGVGSVEAIGAIGPDPFGRELLDSLGRAGIGHDSVVRDAAWQTVVFAKPHAGGRERSRIDFGGCNRVSETLAASLVERIGDAARHCDVVVCNQQVPSGLLDAPLIERLNELVRSHEQCLFVADSRDRPHLFRGVVRKTNLAEARRLVAEVDGGDAGRPEAASSDEPRALLRRLHQHLGGTTFLTRGAEGLLVAEDGTVELLEVPAVRVTGEIDPVGAGDAVTAAIAAILGARGSAADAARIAVLAAAVTVTKLRRTGTATPAEIREAATW